MSTSELHTSANDERCPRRRSTRRRLTALLLITVLIVGACAGNSGDDESSSGDMGEADSSETGGDDAATDEAAPSETSEEGGAESAEGDRMVQNSTDGGGTSAAQGEAPPPTATPVALTPADLGRSIVYTATLDLQAGDVNAAAAEARQAVGALGGVVFGQESTSSPQPRTVLVFKVGPDQFQAALDALSGLGEVVRRDVSADDVTDRIVDLQSQIASAEVSVARLRELLDDASSLEAIASLEAQLLQRETLLEQLRGQLRTLQDQVALSTITLTITQPAATPVLAVASTAYAGLDDGARCPGSTDLSLDEGDDATLCLTIENAGNVAVSDIEVSDHRLGIDPDEVTLVGFDEGDQLAPGDQVVAWATFVAEPDVAPAPAVSAVPIDDSGTQLRVATRSEVTPMALDVAPDESLPGFGDALGAGAGALGMVLGVLIVIAGLALPFLVIGLPVAAAVIWWRRRDSSETPPAPAAG
jgi:hypothetical protein